ncbi:MAG: FAD-binding oxidoreductase [Hyphomicrobiaceae bacterium]|nr:FAD-binding oxidoreductase [Hyphomicrobiaceae bacterium]
MQKSTKPVSGAAKDALLKRFADIVGPEHVLVDPDQQLPYVREWRDKYFGTALAVLRPNSTEQVAAILKVADETGTAIVPQSGNTGLVGGQVPDETGTEVVLSLARMNRIRAIDATGYSMTVEAGVTLAEAQDAAAKAGRLYALSLPSEGTCRIGGNLSTNAGGVNVLAYGNARAQVLGLEVVLADGRVWNGLKALKKDNTGYDLKDLFIGAEGTLGIITAAVLRLLPLPAERATAMVAIDSPETALRLFTMAQDRAGSSLTGFELLARICVETVLNVIEGTRDPFDAVHPWYIVLEVSGLKEDGSAHAIMEQLLEEAFGEGLLRDAVIATSLTQANALWRLREAISEAQKSFGGNVKHDVSVPIARIPEFIRRADELVAGLCPGARPVALGHFGDGNIHYNVAQPVGADTKAFLARWDEIMNAVHGLVISMNGSISAEHGIGRMKREELAAAKSNVEMDLMRAIKAAFDPKGILNPGKVV